MANLFSIVFIALSCIYLPVMVKCYSSSSPSPSSSPSSSPSPSPSSSSSSSSSSSTSSTTNHGPIQATINTRHNVQMRDVPSEIARSQGPGVIEVKSDNVPSFFVKFNSASSRVNLIHEHDSAPKKQIHSPETFSEDEPHIMRHRVEKPIIQEVHEIISPFRRIIQKIEPVKENIKTIVAKSSSSLSSPSNGYHSNQQQQHQKKPKFSFQMTMPGGNKINVNSDQENSDNVIPSKKLNTINNSNELEIKRKPDLEISENEWIDLSLYNGNALMDIKYVSTTDDSKIVDIQNHKYQLYRDR